VLLSERLLLKRKKEPNVLAAHLVEAVKVIVVVTRTSSIANENDKEKIRVIFTRIFSLSATVFGILVLKQEVQ
jgi:hypothetical protein